MISFVINQEILDLLKRGKFDEARVMITLGQIENGKGRFKDKKIEEILEATENKDKALYRKIVRNYLQSIKQGLINNIILETESELRKHEEHLMNLWDNKYGK